MLLLDIIPAWGRKRFTPQTLPADYRSLLLLALLNLDYHIQSTFYKDRENDAGFLKGRDAIFSFGMDYIGLHGAPGLTSEDFCSFSRIAANLDPLEISFQLAEIFLAHLPPAEKIPLAELLAWPEANWKRVLEAASFCAEMENGPPKKRAGIQAKFLPHNFTGSHEKPLPPVWKLIDFRMHVYFYYYCNIPQPSSPGGSPAPLDKITLCAFIYEVMTTLFGKILASLTTIRLWQIFSEPAADILREVEKLYKCALFDRAHNVFRQISQKSTEPILISQKGTGWENVLPRNAN